MKRKKIIVITRHGKTPIEEANGESLDSLLDESVRSLYQNTGGSLVEFARDFDVNPKNTFVKHSDKNRTVSTAKAILAGVYGLNIPATEDDLDSFDFEGLEFSKDPMLTYEGIEFNTEEMYKGMTDYCRKWIANPNTTEYEGQVITPFNQVIQTRRKTLVDALDRVINGKDILGIISSHGTLVEALIDNAINAGKEIPGIGVDQYGGLFGKEDYATITLEEKGSTGLYDAQLERDGEKFPVNVYNLINE